MTGTINTLHLQQWGNISSGGLTTTWAPFSFRGLGLMRGDIMYNSSTKATMKAATTRSMMNGRSSHHELMKSQSAIVELNASSEDMGESCQSLACAANLAGQLLGSGTELLAGGGPKRRMGRAVERRPRRGEGCSRAWRRVRYAWRPGQSTPVDFCTPWQKLRWPHQPKQTER